jgi:hypothetical protein
MKAGPGPWPRFYAMLLTGDLIPRVCLAINRQTRKLPERVAGTEHEIPKPSRKLIKDELPSGRNCRKEARTSHSPCPLLQFRLTGDLIP